MPELGGELYKLNHIKNVKNQIIENMLRTKEMVKIASTPRHKRNFRKNL